MGYYQYHVFFCVNQRDDGRKCCADAGAQALRDYAKKKIKELGLSGAGKVRINMAGCLDRCGKGPVVVIYPKEIWYKLESTADVDELIESHLIGGRVVERLKVD